MDYRDVIKPDEIDEYIKYHKKFFSHIADINTDIFFMERFLSFPFKELKMLHSILFYSIINDNMFQNLVVKIHRLINDNDSDVFTLIKYKNKIMKNYIKDEFKSKLIEQIKMYDLNEKKYLDIRDKIKTARNEFIAHRNMEYFNHYTEKNLVEFNEMKNLVLRINDFFKAISFNVDDTYEASDGYTIEIRKAIVDTFSHIVDKNVHPLVINSEYLNPLWELAKNELTGEAKNIMDSFIKQVSTLKLD